MRRDPRLRADGQCARPGCRKPVPRTPPKTMPRSLRAQFMRELETDPFCSTNCCRTWHHCEAPGQGDRGSYMSADEAFA